jgi:HAD superfamily hydrolase (TIGR01484 family)
VPAASEIKALALDYDRTLTTEDLRPVPRALDLLDAARRRGLKVIVVSGRDMAYLDRVLGRHADALVAENGCLWKLAGGAPQETRPRLGDVRKALEGLDVETEFGEVLASMDAAHHDRLADHFRARGFELDLVRNRDRVMVLPRGVDKAVGLLAALRALGVAPHDCAAAGDGENDVPLLRAVGHGIAVLNAVPELKDEADEVVPLPGGEGIAHWVSERWLPAQGADA